MRAKDIMAEELVKPIDTQSPEDMLDDDDRAFLARMRKAALSADKKEGLVLTGMSKADRRKALWGD